jgi:SAM-dependent methyltransferase
MPDAAFLEEYYRGYFPGDAPKITMPQVNRFVNRLLRDIPFNASAGTLRILDFGGGDGTLGLTLARKCLAAHAALHVEFTLVDYQAPRQFEPNKRLHVIHERQLQRVEGDFDLILAGAVLEHIPQLQPVLDRLFGALAPGGWFYARTPYVAPLQRLLPNLDLTYPGHVHDLGPPFWNRVPHTFDRPLRIAASRPSIIETGLRRHPVRTVVAWLMKLPARIELALLAWPHTPIWRLVGGWEVILQRERQPGGRIDAALYAVDSAGRRRTGAER